MKRIAVSIVFLLAGFTVFAQNAGGSVAIYPQTVVHVKDKSAFFSPDGKYFVTGAFNDQVHVWDFENSNLLKTYGYEVKGYPKNYKYFDESVFPVFSPDGTKIAALFRSNPKGKKQTEKLVIYDTETGERVYDDNSWGWGGKGHIPCMAFSNSGRLFVYVENRNDDDGVGDYITITILSVNRRSSDRLYKKFFYAASWSEILSVSFSRNDRILALGTVDDVTLLDLTKDNDASFGSLVLAKLPSAPVYALKYTKDGNRIIAADGGNVKVWDTGNNRLLRTLQGKPNANVMSLALSSDDKYVVASFSDQTIMKWDITKEKAILNINSIPAVCGSVDVHSSNKYILAGRTDGTISCLDFATGKEMVNYMSFAVDEWVAITPDGYYSASSHGDEYINLRIDNEVYGVNQFSKAYNHPNVVAARLKGLTDPAVVKHFGNILLSVAPPAVMVELKNKNNAAATGIAELNVRVVDAFKKYPLENVEIIINGRLLGGAELNAVTGGQVTAKSTKLIAKKGSESLLDFSIPVKLEGGNNYIEVTAANEACYGLGTLELAATVKNQDKPDLWLLSIGINDYLNLPAERPDDEIGLIDLDGSVRDAKRIMETFSDQQGKRYKTVHSRLIANGERITPTRANILANMNFFKQSKPEDLIILFIAAHGVTVDNEFYVLPSDTTFDKTGLHPDLPKTIDVKTILDAVDIPGRKMVIIDTCQSGGVDNNMLIRTLKNRSIAIFTAAQQNELAQESEEYGGHFTYSLVEGLKGDAANNKSVIIDDLVAYVSDTVAQLSRVGGRGKVRQRPNIIVPDGFKNFVIAEIK